MSETSRTDSRSPRQTSSAAPHSSAAAPAARLAGVLFALAATVIWSGNFIVARGLTDVVPPITLAFLRWSTAFCVLLPFGLRPFLRDWPAVRRQFGFLTVTALFGITLFNTMLYVAAHTTSALNLSLIAITSPLFIMLFARMFLGERVSLQRLAGVAVVVCGVVLLVTRGELVRLAGLQFAIGDLWMLCAAMLFGAYTIMVRRLPEPLDQRTVLMATFGLGTLMLVPGVFWEWHQGLRFAFTPTVFGTVAYVGIGASLIAFWCWNRAVGCIGPSQAGIVYYSLPLFSGAEAVLLLGEPVSWVHFVSGGLILGGIRAATRSS